MLLNGSFTYTPEPDFNGIDTFTYKANDTINESNTATVYITVTAVNDPPVANDDSYTINEGGTLNIPLPGVLNNDTDTEGNTLTAIIDTNPTNAISFTLNSDGSFNYIHDGSETTSDSFTYHANDGSDDSNVATVTITINPINDPPVANDDYYTTAEETILNVLAPGVLNNDTDDENDPLNAVMITDVTNGTLTLHINGSFTYTPELNFNGIDTVTNLNDPPVANDDYYTTAEETILNVAALGVLINDTDPDNDPLTASLRTDPSHGILTFSFDGSFIYEPDENYYGTDSFTYRAYDSIIYSDPGIVYINITPINDPPVANDDYYITFEDTILDIAAPGILNNDTDAENDTLSAFLVNDVSNGILTLNNNGSFLYSPDANYYGSDSFTYNVSDGLIESNTATVYITIIAVNDAPVAFDDYYIMIEENTLNVSVPGVLVNDTDIENDILTAEKISDPVHGDVTFYLTGSFIYIPYENYTGTDSFIYRAYDGNIYSNPGIVYINITPIDDPPVANDDYYTTAEETILNVLAPGVLNNDTDPDNDPLNAVMITDVTNGTLTLHINGSFTYTPELNFKGGTLNVAALGVLGNDYDNESNPLTAVLDAGPNYASSFTLNSDGSFNYIHDGSETTSDSFTYPLTQTSQQ